MAATSQEKQTKSAKRRERQARVGKAREDDADHIIELDGCTNVEGFDFDSFNPGKNNQNAKLLSDFSPLPRSIGNHNALEDTTEPKYVPKQWCSLDPSGPDNDSLDSASRFDALQRQALTLSTRCEVASSSIGQEALNPHLASSAQLDALFMHDEEVVAPGEIGLTDDYAIAPNWSQANQDNTPDPFASPDAPVAHGISLLSAKMGEGIAVSHMEKPRSSGNVSFMLGESSSSTCSNFRQDTAGRFDGIWRDKYLLHVISGRTLTWSNKLVSSLKAIANDTIAISFNGKVVQGTLDASGNSLLWDDGDCWIRLMHEGSKFDGTWVDNQLCHLIQGQVLQWSNNEITHVELVDSNTVALLFNGKKVEGHLSEDCNALHWNDGYTWIRAGLDGVWQEGWSSMRNVLQGTSLIPSDGVVRTVEVLDKSSVQLIVEAKIHKACLDPLGMKLTWSDGDVWTRVMGRPSALRPSDSEKTSRLKIVSIGAHRDVLKVVVR